MLQAALNGRRSRAEHDAVPLSPADLQRDAIACAAAGAHAFHIHPRDADGIERLDAAVVDSVSNALHDATRWPVSVSTGEWIEGDLRRRCLAVARWTGPDSASVNVHDDGAFDLIRTLLGHGTEVEAGVWTVEDAEALVHSGLGVRVHRVLVELIDVPPGEVVTRADAIHRVLDRAGLIAPRLQHGEEASTWPALEDAVRRRIDTRIGLEDVLLLPDGSWAADNAALVRSARLLGAA